MIGLASRLPQAHDAAGTPGAKLTVRGKVTALFEHDYNLQSLQKIRVRGHDFCLYVTPRFVPHYSGNDYEAITALIVHRRAKKVHTFIDVGAHYGFFSVLVGHANPDCRILAFEPIPVNFEILRKNIELNGFRHVRLFQSAVSSRDGDAVFQVSAASDNSGFLANPAAGILQDITVRVATLDQLIEDIPNKPTLIKIDTEGSERQVLQGMEGLIEKVDELEMIIEFNQRCLRHNGLMPEELLRQIDELGFSIFFVHDEKGFCERYENGTDWRALLDGKNYKNLYCIKKAALKQQGLDPGIPVLRRGDDRVSTDKTGGNEKRTNERHRKQIDRKVQRVLLINHNVAPYELTGTPLTTINHARRMRAKGLSVSVLIPDSSILRGFDKKDLGGIPVYKTPKLDQGMAFLSRIPAEWLQHYEDIINQVLEDFLPDIVHINDYVYLPSDIIRYISRRGIPVVRNICNTEEICYRIEPVLNSGRIVNLCAGPENMERCAECYQRSNGLQVSGNDGSVMSRFTKKKQFLRDMYDTDVSAAIFTTLEFKDYFTSFIPIREDKIHIVPRGFDFGQPRPSFPVKIDGKYVKFGFVGSGTPRKGIDTLLRAIETLVYNNIEIHLYGDIGHEDFVCWIHELQKKHHHKIFCHGLFPPSDLPRIASEIHCAIIPSYFETYNRVIREMLWLGVPVLSTDFFGSSIILNGVNGFRIARGDSCSLANHLTRIIENPSILETLSRGALETSIPSLEVEINSLLGIYEDLFARNRHPSSSCRENHISGTSDVEMRRCEGILAEGPAKVHSGILKLFVTAGKRAEALQALERLVESFPDYAPAYNDLGILHYEFGKGDKALSNYEKAVSLDPENATFQRNIADFLYAAAKQPEKALPHYEKALSLNPRDVETLLILGNIRAETGDFPQAREIYLRVLEIDPSNDLAGSMFEALEARAEEPGKRDPETLVREARCLARRGRTERAVQLLETLLSNCPDHAAAHNDLGNLYCLLQKPDEALRHLERAVQLAPDSIGFVRDLADAHLAEAGNLELALALYNKALALKPDDIETLLRIGNVCAAKSLHDDARFFYDRVLAIEPCHTMALENIEQLGKLAPSRSSTRRPKTLLQRCRTYLKEGTRNESIVILEDLIAYHVEQNRDRDDPFTPHVSLPHSVPRGHEDTADILSFGSRIASASSASRTALTLETNKRLIQEEIRQKKTNIASLPLNIEIASTNVCNIMPPCVHCWKHIDPQHGYLNRDARHIPQRFLTHLSPYISCAGNVALHGAGEPLTCDYLFEVVKHVDQAACVGFASNGLLLNERNIEKVLESNIHYIDFSIDAASPDTYRKIRHSDFNRLVCNIKNLVSQRDAKELRFPEVRINMCLMLENMSEIPAFVKLGKELDAAVVHLFHLNEGADYQCGWFHYKEQHCRLRPREHDEFVRAGFAAAADLGVNLLFSGKKYFDTSEETHVLHNREVTLDRFWCSKPWDSLLVQTNGDIYNCCWQIQPIGTLRQQTFMEIWNGKMLQAVRRSTLNGTPHPICNNTQNPCPFLGRV